MARSLQLKVHNKHDMDAVAVPLASNEGTRLTFMQLRETARALVDTDTAFTLKYVDSDGDLVTIGSDADLREVEEYMVDEQLDHVTVIVKTNRNVHQHLRGLVSAISKLTTQVETKVEEAKPPTVADAIEMITAAVTKWDVAADATELVSVKDDLLAVLGDDEFHLAVEALSATDEYKELADAMVASLFKKDEGVMEETITERFDALFAFAQRLFVECPSLKTVFIRLAKSCVKSLTKYNQELIAGADVSDASSVSSGMSSFATVSVEEEERSEADTTASMPRHFGIICDGCEMAPIVGVRYKSLEVHDFDVCEKCEASGKWVSHEPFIKITDPLRAPKQKRPTAMVHPFVTCDGCEMSPIVGARFKSSSAHDFDLCESCEASGAWTETHGPFVKIEEPSMVRALKHCFRRGEGKWWKKHYKHHGHYHHGRHGSHEGEQHAEAAAMSAEEAILAPPAHPHHGHHGHHWFPGHHSPHGHHGHHHRHHGKHHHGHHHHHHHHGKDHHHHHHGHHGRCRRGLREVPELQAKFVEDVSIEDGTVVDPSTALCKMWKIENSGETAWPAGCYMAMQEGSHGFGMNEASKIELPALNPGDEVIAVANLTAPSVPGRYTSYWRVCKPEGACFGHRFWIDIIVANSSDDVVVPEAAPVATTIDESNAAALPEAIVCNDTEMVEVLPEPVAETVAAAVEEVAEGAEAPIAEVVDVELIEGEEAIEPEGDIEAVDVADIYEGALAMLESMGFGDIEKNRRLLEAWGGSVVDALNELLSE